MREPVVNQDVLHRVWTDPVYFLAFGFGSGLSRFAPGTMGTLVAIPLYLLLQELPLLVYLLILAAFIILGVSWCDTVERALGVHDYPGIVWDEIVGYWVTMIAAPKGIFWVVLGFVLFRLFDIWKPNPVGWVNQKVKGGLGVVADDVVAGIIAWVVLQLIAWAIDVLF